LKYIDGIIMEKEKIKKKVEMCGDVSFLHIKLLTDLNPLSVNLFVIFNL
jgi:hypothetical protein